MSAIMKCGEEEATGMWSLPQFPWSAAGDYHR